MLQQEIYNYILMKANLTTQEITIKGNFVFLVIGDRPTMLEASTLNAFDTVKNKFIPMAETIDEEIPFRENNNRSDWVKQYAFQFPLRLKTEVITALNELRDYFYTHKTHTITDGSTNYTFDFKVSRPRLTAISPPQAGDVYITYSMQFTGVSIEHGKMSSGAVIKMRKDGVAALVTLLHDTITVSSKTAFDPLTLVDDIVNTKNNPLARGVGFQCEIYYDDSTTLTKALADDIYNSIGGKLARTTKFDFETVFNGITSTYECYISGGSYVFKDGLVQKLIFEMVEV